MNIESNWDKSSMISSSERGLEFYEERLGISRDQLKNKMILDLGSGKETALAEDVSVKVEGAKVVSLSPHYSDPHYQKELENNPQKDRAVAAVAEKLPFRDGTFDYVFAIRSVPYYFHGRDEDEKETKINIKTIFSEAMRLLNPGGEARFNPYNELDIQCLKEVLDKTENGAEFEISENEESQFLMLKRKEKAQSEPHNEY